jgi:RimJ/RimL family protein N-acetyltransferase
MAYPFRTGARVYLRAAERDDNDRCMRWISDPEVNQYLIAGRYPINTAKQNDWFEQGNASKTDVIFAICLRDGDRHIGNCGLHHIDFVDGRAEIGILIGEHDVRGQGFGTEAVSLLCDYAFTVLNLNRIQLGVFENNERARRCYLKVGFKDEGRLRQNRYKNGRHVDELLMSVLREEWRALSEIS